MPKSRPAADVSGRPLDLRDVDLDTFLNPKTIAVIGASEQSAKPNTAMTRKFAAWSKQHGAAFYPVHPTYETVLGHRCYASLADVPGDLDLAIILTGRAVDTFEEVLQRKAKFAVIFAAGFSETGPEGEKLERRLEGLVESGEVRLLGPNTNLNAFEEFRDDLEGPSIALITQSGHQGRPVFQGQEIGIRLTHWAPTGNEVDLEFADFARYFADQHEVGVIACYIEGFKDGRTLMLAADHAAQLQKPIVMVKVGRTAAGQSMAASHTGHLTGSDAVTSAVFRQFGVTRVDGLDDLLEVSAALARTRPDTPPTWAKRQRQPGICVYAISGGTGAHMADLVSAAGLRIPDLTKKSQQALHDGLIPSYLRVSNPVDCGGPPVADARGRQILDVILADDNIDIVIIPITGAVVMFSEPFTRDIIAAAQSSKKPIFVVWGAPSGTDDTYYKRLLDGGLPVFRTFDNCIDAVRAYQDYWTFAARYRSPFDDAPIDAVAGREEGAGAARRPRAGRGALGMAEQAAAEGVRHQVVEGRARELGRRGGAGRRRDRLSGRDEGVVARPVAQERRGTGRGRCRFGEGSARHLRRVAGEGPEGRQARADRGGPRLRDGERRRRDADRRRPGPALRTGRDRRARRHLRRGVRRRDVPRAAVRRGRGAPRAARAEGLQAARGRARRRSRPTSTRSSTR